MLRLPIPRSQKANSRPHPSLAMQQNTPPCRYSRITDLLREKSQVQATPPSSYVSVPRGSAI